MARLCDVSPGDSPLSGLCGATFSVNSLLLFWARGSFLTVFRMPSAADSSSKQQQLQQLQQQKQSEVDADLLLARHAGHGEPISIVKASPTHALVLTGLGSCSSSSNSSSSSSSNGSSGSCSCSSSKGDNQSSSSSKGIDHCCSNCESNVAASEVAADAAMASGPRLYQQQQQQQQQRQQQQQQQRQLQLHVECEGRNVEQRAKRTAVSGTAAGAAAAVVLVAQAAAAAMAAAQQQQQQQQQQQLRLASVAASIVAAPLSSQDPFSFSVLLLTFCLFEFENS
ncbi:WD-40 repeat-containing protein, putative [Eimeria brunetti]|uniref:WD-40 repeat-containing protein, putative n=1 Tax=Eimeria brunetti TaxID=51314 RepID=U6M120_9EIME|nr:WD-40 repeat-containing protein, putative [Eimeria brunetti]